MIDPAGMLRLFRTDPAQVWHVVERGDQLQLVALCGITAQTAGAEQQSVAVDGLLGAGRICLECAQALIDAP
jgi:hypothetical protein